MIAFATEFPVSDGSTIVGFIAAVRKWLCGSPHTEFSTQDLVPLGVSGAIQSASGDEFIECILDDPQTPNAAAIRYLKSDGSQDWTTEVAYSGLGSSKWVGTRVSCESKRPAARLPAAKKPVLIDTLLKELIGGRDGIFGVGGKPIRLMEAEVDKAASCILGKGSCKLPIVYVSAAFNVGYSLNPENLAEKLAGMAHVVVEPSRVFSTRLMLEVGAQNVYGGTIGIYWPDGGGRRAFFLSDTLNTPYKLQQAVISEITTALANRRPTHGLTWAAVQEAVSRSALLAMRQSGDSRLQEYMDVFDKEQASKDEQIRGAEREIQRLKAELRKYEAKCPLGGGISLETGEEQDFYPNEILDIVRSALCEASKAAQPDSRRSHVLKAICASNEGEHKSDLYKARLQTLLRGYRKMDARIRQSLQEIGFEVSEDGKHYKLVFQGDDRYTSSLPKTSGDHRAGLNAASQIARQIF